MKEILKDLFLFFVGVFAVFSPLFGEVFMAVSFALICAFMLKFSLK